MKRADYERKTREAITTTRRTVPRKLRGKSLEYEFTSTFTVEVVWNNGRDLSDEQAKDRALPLLFAEIYGDLFTQGREEKPQ